MLTENDVISAICDSLKGDGFYIKLSLHTSQPGIDFIAVKNGYTLYIEVKGKTSLLETSKRFGEPYNYNQIKSHIG